MPLAGVRAGALCGAYAGAHKFSRTLFGLILGLTASRPLFTADYYAIDGVTGKVASFVDWSDPTHTLSQSTSAKQVAIPAVHADYPGELCATFAAGQRYTSNRSATAHDYLQNGPIDFATILTPTLAGATQLIWANANPGVSAGASLLIDDGGPMRHHVNRTGGSAQIDQSIVTNTPYYAYGYVDAAGSPQRSFKVSGVTAATGALPGTDIAGAQPLSFGGTTSDTLLLNARVAVLMHLAPILTAAQRNQRAQWAATYGVAA